MSMLGKITRVTALCAAVAGAACGGDDSESKKDQSADSSKSGDGGTESLYLVGSGIVASADTSLLYLWTTDKLDGAKLDPKQAREFPGGEAWTYGGYVYTTDSLGHKITRHELQGNQLVAGPTIDFGNRASKWLMYTETVLSPTRAFVVNAEQLKLYEWNPTTMTITATHDLSALKREGWGNEFRGALVRDDGKLIFYWTYTNDRTDFVNNFVVGVWDASTNTLSFEEDATCPASAGFGGYIDEQGDTYLIADSFGLFTQFGGFKDPKPACIRRVKKGESKLDPTFTQHPSEALEGKFPWGLYYLGNGLAFTAGIDPAVTGTFKSVFETLYAPLHEGYLLDTRTNTARKIANLPKDGVGFEGMRVDGRLLVPRTAGAVSIENVMSTDGRVYEIKPDATAIPVFELPGTVSPIVKVR